jgi:hypothetical protein
LVSALTFLKNGRVENQTMVSESLNQSQTTGQPLGKARIDSSQALRGRSLSQQRTPMDTGAASSTSASSVENAFSSVLKHSDATDVVISQRDTPSREGGQADRPAAQTMTLRSDKQAATKPDQNLRLLRLALLEPIYSDLVGVAQRHGQLSAIGYAADLLGNLRDFPRRVPNDPFGSVVSALHDALSYKNRWQGFPPESLLGAKAVLETFATKSNFSYDDMPKAIQALEQLGLDTTPIEISLDVLAEIDSWDDDEDE